MQYSLLDSTAESITCYNCFVGHLRPTETCCEHNIDLSSHLNLIWGTFLVFGITTVLQSE